MKKITLLFGIIITLSLSSFAQTDALGFNEKLVSLQKELVANITNISKNKSDSISAIDRYKKMQAEVQRKIAEMVEVKGPSDGDDFKNAMLDEFVNIDAMYDIILKLADPKTLPEERAQLNTKLTEVKAQGKIISQTVSAEQKKFTTLHNLPLQ